jgi:hypothetical protein
VVRGAGFAGDSDETKRADAYLAEAVEQYAGYEKPEWLKWGAVIMPAYKVKHDAELEQARKDAEAAAEARRLEEAADEVVRVERERQEAEEQKREEERAAEEAKRVARVEWEKKIAERDAQISNEVDALVDAGEVAPENLWDEIHRRVKAAVAAEIAPGAEPIDVDAVAVETPKPSGGPSKVLKKATPYVELSVLKGLKRKAEAGKQLRAVSGKVSPVILFLCIS